MLPDRKDKRLLLSNSPKKAKLIERLPRQLITILQKLRTFFIRQLAMLVFDFIDFDNIQQTGYNNIYDSKMAKPLISD